MQRVDLLGAERNADFPAVENPFRVISGNTLTAVVDPDLILRLGRRATSLHFLGYKNGCCRMTRSLATWPECCRWWMVEYQRLSCNQRPDEQQLEGRRRRRYLMQTMKQVRVRAGNLVEVVSTEFNEGELVDVVVTPSLQATPRRASTVIEFLDSLPAGPRAFPSWNEYEDHLRAERESWDR